MALDEPRQMGLFTNCDSLSKAEAAAESIQATIACHPVAVQAVVVAGVDAMAVLDEATSQRTTLTGVSASQQVTGDTHQRHPGINNNDTEDDT